MTHKNEFQSSGTSPSNPDFTVRNEGSILLLTPLNEPARTWIHEHIGRNNGFQRYYPTIVIEPRYLAPILEGIRDSGLDEALQTMHARGGDWFAYQDHCFDSSSLGDLQFLQCGAGRTYAQPPARMPDTTHSIGWRYVLVGKVDLETGGIEVQQ
jgi:hypothetical protein